MAIPPVDSGTVDSGMGVAHSAMKEARALARVRRLAKTDRLRELREEAGLSQSDVARAIGVHPSRVSRWEARLQRPRGKHAVALLALLDGEEL